MVRKLMPSITQPLSAATSCPVLDVSALQQTLDSLANALGPAQGRPQSQEQVLASALAWCQARKVVACETAVSRVAAEVDSIAAGQWPKAEADADSWAQHMHPFCSAGDLLTELQVSLVARI